MASDGYVERAIVMPPLGTETLSRAPARRDMELLVDSADEDPSLVRRPSPAAQAASHDGIVGESPAMRQAAHMIQRFAATDAPVLITGESGTGKELAARAIHERSRRRNGPFVAVNCAALPPNLVASELFGYEKGAFTGAVGRKKGQIELAHGGTLFLDEIGDMPVDMQGHLLRFLQEGRIVRVGGREPIKVDVRIISATNVRLRDAMAGGRFREDLFYRLNVLTLPMPALRERGDDIVLLARHFLAEAARQFGREIHGLDPAAAMALRGHEWRGNVRELMSTIFRAVVMGNAPVIRLADLGLEAEPAPAPARAPRQMRPGSEGERLALLEALSRHQQNVTMAARELGVSRVTLYRMLRRHGIALDRGPGPSPGFVHAEAPAAN